MYSIYQCAQTLTENAKKSIFCTKFLIFDLIMTSENYNSSLILSEREFDAMQFKFW